MIQNTSLSKRVVRSSGVSSYSSKDTLGILFYVVILSLRHSQFILLKHCYAGAFLLRNVHVEQSSFHVLCLASEA